MVVGVPGWAGGAEGAVVVAGSGCAGGVAAGVAVVEVASGAAVAGAVLSVGAVVDASGAAPVVPSTAADAVTDPPSPEATATLVGDTPVPGSAVEGAFAVPSGCTDGPVAAAGFSGMALRVAPLVWPPPGRPAVGAWPVVDAGLLEISTTGPSEPTVAGATECRHWPARWCGRAS